MIKKTKRRPIMEEIGRVARKHLSEEEAAEITSEAVRQAVQSVVEGEIAESVRHSQKSPNGKS